MNLRRPARRATASTLFFLASCVADSSPQPTAEVDLAVSERFQALESQDAGTIVEGWIETFGDERLNELVDEALVHNSDLEQAAARVDFSRALAEEAGADLLPAVDFFAGATRSDLRPVPGIGELTRIEIGLRAAWEPDLWGRLSSTERAATLDAEAAASDYQFARHALAAAVANGWFLAIAARERVEIDQRSIAQRERVERSTQNRFDVGDAPGGDVDIASGQSAAARALLELDRGAERLSLLSLETLVGRYPSGELEASADLPPLTEPPPVGLPSELLERRPDVVAARLAVRAAYERVEAAEAARLPRLTLTASGGRANTELDNLLDPENAIWSLGAGLLAPLFDGGRLRAEADAARAERRAVLANYLGVARAAFLDVESALTNEVALRARERELADAAERLARARERSEERYLQGETTLLDLDQIHIQFYLAERELVQARLELALARVALHLSLGGSFEAQP
jgi:NodT family efflux transporter outer membrane factor (OMF) lipoprotein